MRRGKNRRGATLVLVALSMTVLLGFAAFGVDLSQMGAYRSELQRAADAGAHAGAIQLTKTRYDSAAAIASAFATSNVVFGRAATVDSVEYGTWNNATGTFTWMCTGVTCSALTVKTADAVRITIHGSGTNLFAGILGFFGFTIQTTAVGWAAPTVAKSGCVKPFAAPYKMLTVALNRARGLADTYDPSRYPLEQADLDVIRDNPTVLRVCLKLGATGTTCTAAEAGTSYPGNYEAVYLSPGDVASDYAPNIGSGCFSAGPGDALDVLPGNKAGPTVQGKNEWCANFATGDCVMKAALYDAVAPIGTIATDGQTCTKGAESANGAGWCYLIKMIGSFVLTDVVDKGPGDVKIMGYFTNAIDSGPIGGVKGTLQRPVIAQ
jgi:Flp pilus assembly protein TadG